MNLTQQRPELRRLIPQLVKILESDKLTELSLQFDGITGEHTIVMKVKV